MGTAVDVATRLQERLDEVMEMLAAAYRQEIPEYAALDRQQMEGTVLPISRGIAEAFLVGLREDRPPERSDVPGLDSIGVVRVGMGMPLEPMLHAFRVFGRVVWIEMAALTDDRDVLADLGGRWMDWIDRSSSAAATAYLSASKDLVRRLDARRGAMLEALLEATSGADALAVATEFQTTLADEYTPVVVAGHEVAVRIDALVSEVAEATIAGVRPSGLWLLVPGSDVPVDRLLRVGQADLLVRGLPGAPGASLTRSAQDAQLLLATAERTGRRGIVGPDDLVLERLLASDSAVTRWLEERVAAPLRGGDRSGNIEPTLATYLASGSVPETAATVHAHANTVSYRLSRVADLTGLDPRVPADAAVLHLALLRARDPASGPDLVESTKSGHED